MKKRIGTILDENLINLAKQIAITQNLTLNQLFEEAIRNHLGWFNEENKPTNIVDQTKGAMKVSPELLKVVMAEESFNEI